MMQGVHEVHQWVMSSTFNIFESVCPARSIEMDRLGEGKAYELQFDLARDVGLDYAPRQLFRFKIKPPS
jgi:hypothetical protein